MEPGVALPPGITDGLSALGGIHVRLDQHETAIRYYERALKINPELQSVRRSLADLRRLNP